MLPAIAWEGLFNNDDSLKYLYSFAVKNINYSSVIAQDDVFSLSKEMENVARNKKDYSNLFLIQQITVNLYCQKGEIGLAVDKAQVMYEEAKKLKNDTGLALSLQAMGNTYMCANQYNQANEAFVEAWKIAEGISDNLLKIRLLLQHLHLYMLMENISGMQYYLLEAAKLLQFSDIPDKEDYVFNVKCYQTFYYIAIADEPKASTSLKEIENYNIEDKLFKRWIYLLKCRYYELVGNYTKALTYCDSIMDIVQAGGDLSERKQTMLINATLLIKNGQKKEACSIYKRVKFLSDSMNMKTYSKQVDSMRVTYWIDQMKIENVIAYNRFLKWSIICSILGLLIVSVFIYLAYKTNKKLINSRKRLNIIRQETSDSIHSKSLFLSNMSHDLRTPLNAIVGFADLLSQGIVDDAESKQQFGDGIKQNAALLLKLFNDVADFSALKDKNFRFVFEECEVVSLCRTVLDSVDKTKSTEAGMYFVSPLDVLNVCTDSGRLQQVLINLLVNATKFTSAGSITLFLDVNKEENIAIFTVEDTGCGIPLEKQANIFERFEKLNEGVKGAGLGLSICKLIVERVGGKIWIDSAYTQGTRFVFTHPLEREKHD